MTGNEAVTVYLVDDSAVARVALAAMLNAQEGVRVVGVAATGREALSQIPKMCPSIVLLDVIMPSTNGFETARELMSLHPVPIVLVSDLVGRNAKLSFEGFAAGAVDVVRKPSAKELQTPATGEAWARKLRTLARVPVIRRRDSTVDPVPSSGFDEAMPALVSVVAIGASTGGPRAIDYLLHEIGPNPPWPVLIVQHLSQGFTTGLIEWLARDGARVEEAVNNEVPRPGVYYLAPDQHHLALRGGRFRVTRETQGHSPSADILFRSLADHAEPHRVIGILLTGMGRDGAEGLRELRAAGGWTIAEHESSCVVYGMPAAAVDAGAAREVLDLPRIAGRLKN
ncbi:MAG: chemotaxis-specific protein-glutamate methyltransferase CheB [Myxococcota bacterium]